MMAPPASRTYLLTVSAHLVLCLYLAAGQSLPTKAVTSPKPLSSVIDLGTCWDQRSFILPCPCDECNKREDRVIQVTQCGTGRSSTLEVNDQLFPFRDRHEIEFSFSIVSLTFMPISVILCYRPGHEGNQTRSYLVDRFPSMNSGRCDRKTFSCADSSLAAQCPSLCPMDSIASSSSPMRVTTSQSDKKLSPGVIAGLAAFVAFIITVIFLVILARKTWKAKAKTNDENVISSANQLVNFTESTEDGDVGQYRLDRLQARETSF